MLVIAALCAPASGPGRQAASEAPAVDEGELRVMSWNIRYDNPRDGEHRWSARRERAVALVLEFNPDIAGFQEVLSGQFDDLRAGLDGYTIRGVGRDDGVQRGEASPIAFRAERFEEIEWGTWWLSPTPEEPSRGWDAALPRIATWMRLRDLRSDAEIMVVNTHFDHVGAEARRESARLLHERLQGESTVLLVGDFNAVPGSDPHRILTASLLDAAGDDESPTWTDFDGVPDPGRRIDWILTRGMAVNSYRVPAWQDPSAPQSDHLPVFAVIAPHKPGPAGVDD